MDNGLNRIGLFGLRHVYLGCGCVVAVVLASSARAKTLEAVEKELVQTHGRLKSYTAKIETKQDMDLGQGNKLKSENKGTMEWMRRGPKNLYRMEMKGTSVTVVSGKETKSKATSTVVCDGEFLYTLSDTDGQKTATKLKAGAAQSFDVKFMFKTWGKEYTLKLLPDEKFDGKDCYVIQAIPKKKDPHNPMVEHRCWFRKDLGMMVKMVMLGKGNKPMTTSTTTEVKVNVNIKPERFKFKVPPGVQLMDMTKLQTQPAPSEEPAAEEGETEKESDKPAEQEPPAKKEKDKGLRGLFEKVLK